jgi:hypothetical protein
MPTSEILHDLPLASLVVAVFIIASQVVRIRLTREVAHKAAEVRHGEILAQLIALRRVLRVHRRSPRAGRDRRGMRNGFRARPSGQLSPELFAILRGVYDADAAVQNPWEPEEHCTPCREGCLEETGIAPPSRHGPPFGTENQNG